MCLPMISLVQISDESLTQTRNLLVRVCTQLVLYHSFLTRRRISLHLSELLIFGIDVCLKRMKNLKKMCLEEMRTAQEARRVIEPLGELLASVNLQSKQTTDFIVQQHADLKLNILTSLRYGNLKSNQAVEDYIVVELPVSDLISSFMLSSESSLVSQNP